MQKRTYLQIPGPTNIPEKIRLALAQPMIDHRGPFFSELLQGNLRMLRTLLNTQNDILFMPSSGSGGLEATLVNLLSQGDHILTSNIGVFSERVAKIAERYGVVPIRMDKTWGHPILPEDVKAALAADTEQKIRLVYVPQVETTTGVCSDIEAIGRVIKESGHPTLFVVDAVSSFACLPLQMEQWNIDVIVLASQKGLMLPPGCGMIVLNNRAWEMQAKATLPKWYWDFKPIHERMQVNQFPYTPPTSIFMGMKASLEMILEEGLENVIARHQRNADLVRECVKVMGLELFAEPGYEANTVTAIKLPVGIDFPSLDRGMQQKFSVSLGTGLESLNGKIFRIGHMGALDLLDVYAILGAVEMQLRSLGVSIPFGTSAAKFQELLSQSK